MPTNTRLVLAAAVAALSLPLVASAQFRVGSDGQALDANNRVGSAGYNANRETYPIATQQNIFTGTVAGGRQFRNQTYVVDPKSGRSIVVNTPVEQDPGAFRGNLGSASFDPFLARSAAAPVRGTPSVNAPVNYGGGTVSQPFYGNNITNAPEGYARDPYHFTGTYSLSQPPLTRGAVDLNYNIPPTLNQIYNNAPNANIPPAGLQDQALIGAQGANGLRQVYAAAPNGLITQWQPNGGGPDQYYLSRTTSYLPVRPDAGRPVDAATLARYRAELGQTLVPDNATPNNTGPQNANAPQPNNPNPLASPVQSPGTSAQAITNTQNPLNRPNPTLVTPGQPQTGATQTPARNPQVSLLPHNPTGQPLNAQPLNPTVGSAAGDFRTNESTRTIYPAAAQQSTQLAELQRLNNEKNQTENGAPGGPKSPDKSGTRAQPTKTGADNKKPGPNGKTPAAGANKTLQITSLATGIRARGLSSLLTNAEDLMKQGKYTSAIARYEAAQQVAPNNPLPVLGQAFAELGGGYYQRAELDLRKAVLTEPALLQGDYDLAAMLGNDRLQTVVRDLKAQTADDPKRAARPLILLAFIAHNSGSPDKAADYLVTAREHIGADDPLIAALRRGWAVSPAVPNPGAPNPNK